MIFYSSHFDYKIKKEIRYKIYKNYNYLLFITKKEF